VSITYTDIYGIPYPKCGHHRMHVLETREKGPGILRRRSCPKCGARLTTRETPLCAVPVTQTELTR